MKVLKPFYYDDFKCTANECIDNCCSNWRINIDEKTYKKYKKLKMYITIYFSFYKSFLCKIETVKL